MSLDSVSQASITSPRRPTSQEWTALKNGFPAMDKDNIWVIGEATNKYNCLAWTVNVTDKWLWPWPTGQKVSFDDFVKLYAGYNATPATSGNIAAYGASTTDMKHGARQMTITAEGIGLTWTSKLGPDLLVTHKLSDLVGNIYGNVQGYFNKVFSNVSEAENTEAGTATVMMPLALTEDQSQYIHTKVDNIDTGFQQQFTKAYEDWQGTWLEPSIRFSSRPQDRTESNEFYALVMMGPAIVPLLMEKIQQGEFFALLVVERLVHPGIVFQPSESDVLRQGGEQRRAYETLVRWIAVTG